jgi:hypothetical protein
MAMKRATAAIEQNADTAIPPITSRPEYVAALRSVLEIEAALDQRQRMLDSMKARRRGETSKRSASERALDLVKGGRLVGTPTDDEVERVHDEIGLLRQAYIEKHAILDRVAGELAYAESRALRPAFDRYMDDALQAMSQLAAAFRGASDLAAVLYAAGYRPSGSVLPHLIPSGAALLGDPAAQGSEAWYFARALAARQGEHR